MLKPSCYSLRQPHNHAGLRRFYKETNRLKTKQKLCTFSGQCTLGDDLLGEGSQLVFSADKPPKKLDVDEHLRARLGMGLIAELTSPDITMKSNLVRVKAGERGVLLQDDVVEYISANMGPNISDIEGAITSIVAFSELTRPVITLDTAKNVLKDVIIE